jgi:hypothetical protein
MVESMKIACMPKITLYPTGDERSRRSTQVSVKIYTDKKENKFSSNKRKFRR